MRPGKLGVVISDDDAMIRDALREVLDAEPDLEVVGVAADADEAIALTRRYAPAVVVLDVRMPGGGGGRAAREISRLLPGTGILALSAHVDRTTVEEIRRAGVTEYVVKGAPNHEIVAAVRRLATGRTSR